MSARTTIAVGLGILVVVLLVFLNIGGGSRTTKVSDERSVDRTPDASDLARLSDIELVDYSGRTHTLGEYRGKPLVINSWAVWCPFCRQELPDFATLQKEFADVVVIAIDRAEPLEKAKGYTDELSISGSMVFLLDPDDAFYRTIGGFSMPETIFIDKEGNIAFHKRGPLTLDEMRSAVVQYVQ